MKTLKNLILLALVAASLVSPAFASNQPDPNILIIPVGAIASGAGAVGSATCNIPIPRGIQISAAYINTTSGITSNATDSIEVSLMAGTTEIGSFNSATASQTAGAPKAFTVSTTRVVSGTVLGVAHTQSASGMNQALANVNVILHYRNSDSQ